MWDYIYITDCVKALRMLGETSDIYGIYNISYGQPKKLKDFVLKVQEIINKNCKVNFGTKKVDEKRTFQLIPSTKKLKQIGFTPEVSFKRGIKEKMNNK